MAFDTKGISRRVYEAMQTDLEMACDLIVGTHAEYCESPIELMVLATLVMQNSFFSQKGLPLVQVAEADEEPDFSKARHWIYPQWKWNGYRIDFRIEVADLGTVFIECDGHDFHERTKEQAERDRSKDREIQQAGIPILRFTGREIYRNAAEVVSQIFVFIHNRATARGLR